MKKLVRRMMAAVCRILAALSIGWLLAPYGAGVAQGVKAPRPAESATAVLGFVCDLSTLVRIQDDLHHSGDWLTADQIRFIGYPNSTSGTAWIAPPSSLWWTAAVPYELRPRDRA